MTLKDDINSGIKKIVEGEMDIRDGKVVPTVESIALYNGGVKIEAVFLYVDLADSTELVSTLPQQTSAKIIKTFLYSMSRLITYHDGVITSFDGDRVMGVYVGERMNTKAALTALKMRWVVDKIIQPKIHSTFKSVREHEYVLKHGVGIDVGNVLAVRAGIRNSNDIVWIGQAPNIAAKLSDIRKPNYPTYITDRLFKRLADDGKYSSDKRDFWESCSTGLPESPNGYRSEWSYGI